MVRHPREFYLSSLDSQRFGTARRCEFLREITIGSNKPGMLVRLTPGVIGQDFNSGEDLTEFLLTTRFEGADLRSIQEFPCFVFIALPRESWDTDVDQVDASDVEVVGWGELYRSAAEAVEHRMS